MSNREESNLRFQIAFTETNLIWELGDKATYKDKIPITKAKLEQLEKKLKQLTEKETL